MTQDITITEAALYVGTYAKYNDGNLFGKWMKFSDYADADDFMTACLELHKDEEDPELMAQDYENFPEKLYRESFGLDDLESIYQTIEVLEKLELLDDSELVSLHNEYCQNASLYNDEIYSFDEEFFETFFSGKVMEAVRATAYGDVNFSHDWIRFNGYANLESISKYDIRDHIDLDAITEDIIENPNNYNL